MNWVDEKGEPVRNACYYGSENGFQIFSFNRLERDGECIDTLAHEFTHCVTTALMTFNIYMNDTGAIFLTNRRTAARPPAAAVPPSDS